MKSASQIAAELRAEGQRIFEMYERLAQILDDPAEPMPLEEPRKRHVRSAESIRKQRATIARNRAQAASQAPQTVNLRVLSSTHPTEDELADRELVHTTEAPAETG